MGSQQGCPSTRGRSGRAGRALVAAGAALALAAGAGAQQAAPVELAEARETALVEELSLTGDLTAPRTARISPEVEGRVAELELEEGDRVEAGDALVALDDELVRLELQQVRASLREARAQLEDARRRLDETRRLAERQSVAATRVRDREAEVEQDAAVVARLEAEAAHRAALLRRHRVEAPFDGVIHERLAELGEWVGPGTPVMELVATDWLRLDLEVPQSYFGRVEEGTEARVRLDARPESELRAAVGEVVPVSNPSSRTFLARVRVENREGGLAPGMSARATLRIETGRRGVVVPRDALLRHPDGRIVVWIAEGEGGTRTVRERRIRTGLAFGDEVAVREGLEAGAAVVVRGNEALQEGQEVRVRSARSAGTEEADGAGS